MPERTLKPDISGADMWHTQEHWRQMAHRQTNGILHCRHRRHERLLDTRFKQPYWPQTWRIPHHNPVMTERQVYISSKRKITNKRPKPPQARLTAENPEYLEEPELIIDFYTNMSPRSANYNRRSSTTEGRTPRGQQYEEKVEVE